MSKVKSRMSYAKDMQDEIQGVVMYAYQQIQLLTRINLRIHTMGKVWFPDTMDGHREERKFEDKEEKVAELYKEIDSYTKQTRYADIYRKFLVDLRDEDDEKEWGAIFKKYRQQILDLKISLNRTHQDFLAEMSEIFRIATEQKRKEREAEMKETTIETLAQNADVLKKTLYEKCNAGELTVEEREAAIAQLNAYTESSERFVSAVNEAVDAYCEGAISCEELDNIVSGYYRENPQQAMFYEGTHIDNRFEAMKNEVVGLYNAEVLTLEDAEDFVNYLDHMYDVQMLEHVKYLHDEGTPCLEHVVSDAMDSYFGAIREFKESAGDASDLETRATALESFTDTTWEYFEEHEVVTEDAGDVMDVVGPAVIAATYLAMIGVILSIPIGRAINNKKGRKLVEAYEYLHPSVIKYDDLRISKLSIEKTGVQYIPELKKHLDSTLRTNGTCFLARYKGKPFAALASIRYEVSEYGSESSAIAMSKNRYFFKALTPEAKQHAEYYEAAMMLRKFKVSTPEIKAFAKDMKSDFEAMKKKEEKAAKATKESTDPMYEVSSETVALVGPLAVVGGSMVASLLTVAIGKAIDKKALNKMLKLYEELHNPSPLISQTSAVVISEEDAMEHIEAVRKYAKQYDSLAVNAVALMYKNKPIVYSAMLKGIHEDGAEGPERIVFDTEPKYDKDANYYILGLVGKKMNVMTAEVKAVIKSIYNELKEEKRVAKVDAKLDGKKAKSSAKAKVAKEYAGVEDVDLQLYEEVLESVMDRYESGEISLELREACIIEARDRIFGDNADLMDESVLSDCRKKVCDKITAKKCDGNIKQMQAKYLAANAEIKRIQKEINDLERMQAQRNIDPITSKRAADKIKKLQAKANKLSSDAQKIYKKMSATDLTQGKTRAFDNYNKKLKAISPVNA